MRLLLLSALLLVACRDATVPEPLPSFEELSGSTDTLGIASARGRTVDSLSLAQVSELLTRPDKPTVLLFWRADESRSLATLTTLTQASNMPSQQGYRYIAVQVDPSVHRAQVDALVRTSGVWYEAYQLSDTTTAWSYTLQTGWDGSTPTTAVTRPGMEPLFYTDRVFGDTLEVAAVLSFLESPTTR